MSVINTSFHLGMKCASTTTAEKYRRAWSRVKDHALSTFVESRWEQFAGVINAIATMRQVVERDSSVPITLRNEIKDSLSKTGITELEEGSRTWIDICNLIHEGITKNLSTYDSLVIELAQKLGGKVGDIRPAFEGLRESFQNSLNFRRVQELGQSQEKREILQKCQDTFTEYMDQISRNRISLISEEALLFIHENCENLKERQCVLILYGLEITLRIIDQIIFQCVIDNGLPEFDSDQHIVKVEPSYGVLVNNISLTLAIPFHPGLRVGSIFRIHAQHMPEWAIALGLTHYFHREAGSYMDISGLALDKDGLPIPLPPLSYKTK